MASRATLPRGFSSIKDACSACAPGRAVNVSLIGVLTHVREIYKSKGDDWVLAFDMQDEFESTSEYTSVIRCKMFRREKSRLPVGDVGDLVLVRNIGLQQFNNRVEAVSSSRHATDVLFFPAKTVPVPELSVAYGYGGQEKLLFNGHHFGAAPTPVEQEAIINVKALANPSAVSIKQRAATQSTQPKNKDRRALIRDVAPHNFYDLVVEVVKTYYVDYSNVDLYVTDYTVNPDLYLYEDPATAQDVDYSTKWQGPFGQTTMAVRLWAPHAGYVKDNVVEGDLIHINNVHVKLSQANKLEGALHEDRGNPNRVTVRKVTSPKEMAQHEARKKAYMKAYERNQGRYISAQTNTHEPKKPSAKAAAKKKDAKKERERLRKEQEQRELEKKAEEKAAARAGINTHVYAGHPEIRLSSVEEILHNPDRRIKTAEGKELELPFVNTKYRTRLRVVDFSPHNLGEFTRSMADSSWNTALRDTPLGERRRDDRWQWAFVLLVEDVGAPAGTTPERFPLFVGNESGQNLLKMNPVDLMQDPHGAIIKKLEEKLFILWGNLFELKKELLPKGVKFPLPNGDERLQNKPFECCIEEYGAKVPPSPMWPKGYQRMFKIAATTIKG